MEASEVNEIRTAILERDTAIEKLIKENKKYRAALEEIIDNYDNDYVGERCLARIAANALLKEF
jgi:hypothetical protein